MLPTCKTVLITSHHAGCPKVWNILHTVDTKMAGFLPSPEVGNSVTLMISLCFTPKSLVAKGSVSPKFTASWAAWGASASSQRWGLGPRRKGRQGRALRTQQTPFSRRFHNLILHYFPFHFLLLPSWPPLLSYPWDRKWQLMKVRAQKLGTGRDSK